MIKITFNEIKSPLIQMFPKPIGMWTYIMSVKQIILRSVLKSHFSCQEKGPQTYLFVNISRNVYVGGCRVFYTKSKLLFIIFG